MKNYFESLKEIFEDLEKTSEKEVNIIRAKISNLSKYCIQKNIDSDFFLKLVFHKDIRNEIQDILAMNSTELYLHTIRFQVIIQQSHREIQRLLNDTQRIDTLIISKAIFEKLMYETKENSELNQKVKRQEKLLKKLTRKINQ
jgi:hypothetical protein